MECLTEKRNRPEVIFKALINVEKTIIGLGQVYAIFPTRLKYFVSF